MRNSATYSFAYQVGMLGLLAALAVFMPEAAYADDAPGTDPFAVESGNWESFDHYKEEKRQEVISAIFGKPAPDEAAPQAPTPAEAPKAPPPSAPEVKTETATPALAQPERPLDLPPMPPMDAQYSLPVKGDEDSKPAARIAHIDADPDLQLPKNEWQSADEAARLHAQGKDDDDAHAPINVRFTPLPSLISASPHKKAAAQVAKTEPMSGPVDMPAPSPVEVKQPTASPAECAAVDNYKKQQIEAIQSDRNTLAALQDAITQLGLKNQLGYMAGMNKTSVMTDRAAADSTETMR